MRPTAAAAALLAAALAAAGCGGSAGESTPEPAATQPAATQQETAAPEAVETLEAVHVHGLGVVDGTVYVATHTGLFEIPQDAEEMTRVGSGRSDLMGFTVAGPDSFLASGHPGPGEDAPGHLGLIESSDRGVSWTPVSLAGEADFHLLDATGDTVYGGDAAGGRFLRSSDGGRTWEPATLPAPTADVAVHPARAQELVVSTEQGLFASSDGARSWRRLAEGVAPGLLAWPEADLLVLVDGDGAVHRSADGGKTLGRVGELPGPPEAVTAAGRTVFAAVHGRGILVSEDAGGSWEQRVSP